MRTVIPILLIGLGACTAKTDTSTQATASSTTDAFGPEKPIASSEAAVAPEVNPPGDIPDSQAFIKYSNNTGGYQLEVPEGWARTEKTTDVTFINKYDGVAVAIYPTTSPPSAATAPANEAKLIQSQGRAVKITKISEANVHGGKAVAIKYTSNSEANSVTNKQVRLENIAYVFYKDGKEAVLTMWAPLGADNVDQWNRMANSFRWL